MQNNIIKKLIEGRCLNFNQIHDFYCYLHFVLNFFFGAVFCSLPFSGILKIKDHGLKIAIKNRYNFTIKFCLF